MTEAAHRRSVVTAVITSIAALICCLSADHASADAGDADEHKADRVHWGASLGWFGALTGPLAHGPAAEVEIFPGGRLGDFGVGVSYRGDKVLGPGLMTVGVVYQAGASRPTLVMSMRADIGYDTASRRPVAGAGVRIQLAVSGPLSLASNVGGHLFLDGIDTRLGITMALTMGLSD